MNEITLHAVEIGRQAWNRIKEDSTYNDWMAVGEALDIGRTECMRLARSNEPRGRAYNETFSKWLAENGFADILAGIIANRPGVETWRATLASNERQRINHPSSVWRKWQASRAMPTSTGGGYPPIGGALVLKGVYRGVRNYSGRALNAGETRLASKS
jgi:hypothetical protein